MRDNGVPDFPDPDANGQFDPKWIEKAMKSPTFEEASRTCEKLVVGDPEGAR